MWVVRNRISSTNAGRSPPLAPCLLPCATASSRRSREARKSILQDSSRPAPRARWWAEEPLKTEEPEPVMRRRPAEQDQRASGRQDGVARRARPTKGRRRTKTPSTRRQARRNETCVRCLTSATRRLGRAATSAAKTGKSSRKP